jgi:hypothetical protein
MCNSILAILTIRPTDEGKPCQVELSLQGHWSIPGAPIASLRSEPLARHGGAHLYASGGRDRQTSGLHSKFQASQIYIVRPLGERQTDRQTPLGPVDKGKS